MVLSVLLMLHLNCLIMLKWLQFKHRSLLHDDFKRDLQSLHVLDADFSIMSHFDSCISRTHGTFLVLSRSRGWHT